MPHPPPPPYALPPPAARTSPGIACPPFGWQSASKFNQPLSFDTSKVTDMHKMFHVRPARALPPKP